MHFSTAAVAAPAPSFALWGACTVHSIPGRVRLRIPALRIEPDLAGSLEALLQALPGITSATVNRWCQSVTVAYDPSVWTPDAINAFVEQLQRHEIEQYEAVRPQQNERTWLSNWIEPSTCWRAAGLITLI